MNESSVTTIATYTTLAAITPMRTDERTPPSLRTPVFHHLQAITCYTCREMLMKDYVATLRYASSAALARLGSHARELVWCMALP